LPALVAVAWPVPVVRTTVSFPPTPALPVRVALARPAAVSADPDSVEPPVLWKQSFRESGVVPHTAPGGHVGP
jgi:hypothetical protein